MICGAAARDFANSSHASEIICKCGTNGFDLCLIGLNEQGKTVLIEPFACSECPDFSLWSRRVRLMPSPGKLVQNVEDAGCEMCRSSPLLIDFAGMMPDFDVIPQGALIIERFRRLPGQILCLAPPSFHIFPAVVSRKFLTRKFLSRGNAVRSLCATRSRRNTWMRCLRQERFAPSWRLGVP